MKGFCLSLSDKSLYFHNQFNADLTALRNYKREINFIDSLIHKETFKQLIKLINEPILLFYVVA